MGHLEEALASIEAQAYPNLEVVFSDDGSTDGTVEFIKKAQPGVLLIEQPNQGPGAARNRGIEAATGEYIAFLDSDDLWFPWTCQSYQKVIEMSGAGLIFGKPHHFRNSDDLENIE